MSYACLPFIGVPTRVVELLVCCSGCRSCSCVKRVSSQKVFHSKSALSRIWSYDLVGTLLESVET